MNPLKEMNSNYMQYEHKFNTLRLISWIGFSESSTSGMYVEGTRPGSLKTETVQLQTHMTATAVKMAAFIKPGDDMIPNQRSMKMKTVEKQMQAMAKTTTVTGREMPRLRAIFAKEGNFGRWECRRHRRQNDGVSRWRGCRFSWKKKMRELWRLVTRRRVC